MTVSTTMMADFKWKISHIFVQYTAVTIRFFTHHILRSLKLCLLIRWVWYMALIGGKINAYSVLREKTKGMRKLIRPRHILRHNMKMNH